MQHAKISAIVAQIYAKLLHYSFLRTPLLAGQPLIRGKNLSVCFPSDRKYFVAFSRNKYLAFFCRSKFICICFSKQEKILLFSQENKIFDFVSTSKNIFSFCFQIKHIFSSLFPKVTIFLLVETILMNIFTWENKTTFSFA